MRLTGLKIFAGNYLLSVIETQELLCADAGNIYSATISALNRYFDQTCDYTKERMKFREMRMTASEPFVDWVLRLENQAKFCEFEAEQRKEEFIQALVRRSVPAIASKLYEMSNIFNNDLERIMAHGRHLDYIRMDTEEGHQAIKVDDRNIAEEVGEGCVVKPVSAVFDRKSELGPMHYNSRCGVGMQRDRGMFDRNNRYRGARFSNNAGRYNGLNKYCSKCGRLHGPKECRAHRVKCYSCGREGHFSEFCFSKSEDSARSRQSWSDRDASIKTEARKINQVK
ncbi:uncharacterized protein LOC134223721 [Armigeres subalbatus]|uniref:uncharacterized protein LOC134223721 n=1 Tax=Armigeres subalbatus TaxID=124917 RepID=UPI002ED28354